MNLVSQLRQFHRLEVMAAEIYRVHVKRCPIWMQPVFHHFLHIEERHVHRFAALYKHVTKQEAPKERLAQWTIRQAAVITSWFGLKRMLAFDIKVEQDATRDYKHALTWIDDKAIREAIIEVLHDEDWHDRYMNTLTLFMHDEQKHIKEMQKLLRQVEAQT